MDTKLTGQIRILIVDDSAFMRKALTMMLESDPAIKVVGTARDGNEGVEKTNLLKPDLVTLDIEMPRMDGLTALREIMQKHPVPVMMVSSITTEGAQATLDALDLGAVDFIPKQMSYVSLDIVKIKEDLIAKIKDIVRRKHLLMTRHRQRQFSALKSSRPGAAPPTLSPSAMVTFTPGRKRKKRPVRVSIVAVGSSTGGPPALQSIIPRLPRNFPVGMVIAQHMPPTFTKSLATRLDNISQVTVGEATDGQKIEPGLVLIAPGGRQMLVRQSGGASYAVVSDKPAETLYKPCVDVMFNSVAEVHGSGVLGVVLTGMGNNGLTGTRSIKSRGGAVIAQNEDTCVVYGMPRAVIDAELADRIVPVDNVAAEIVSYF